MISEKSLVTAEGTTIYSVGFEIISEDHCNVLINTELQSSDDYDIINNAVVFHTAPTAGQNLMIRVGTTETDLTASPTDIGICATNIDDIRIVEDNITNNNIQTIVDNKDDIEAVATNIGDVQRVEDSIGKVDRVYDSITKLDRVYDSITKLDRVYDSTSNDPTTGVSNLDRVFDSIDNVDTVKTHIDNIDIVADNWENVKEVGDDITKVVKVAEDLLETVSEIETAADDLNSASSKIDTVASDIDKVKTVADLQDGTVATNAITTVAARDLDIGTVAARDLNIGTVASRDANIGTVALRDVDIGTVALRDTDIGKVADIDTEVGVVSSLETNGSKITTVAARDLNIGTVASRDTDIGKVAAIDTKVADVADLEITGAKITKVSDIDGDITSVAAIDDKVVTVAGLETTGGKITAVVDNESDISTVAANITDVNNFADTYFTGTTAPASPTMGDLWFDSSTQTMKVYGSSGWQNAGSSVNGIDNSVEYTATAGQTTFNATYDPGFLNVFLNGVKLDEADYTATNGSTVVLDTGAGVGDTVYIQAFGTFALADHYSKTASDARYTQSGDEISLGDNVKAKFGASDDLQIYHSGNHSYITDGGQGNLYLQGSQYVNIRGVDGSSMLLASQGSYTKLYHNGSPKLSTISTGIDVTGNVLNLQPSTAAPTFLNIKSNASSTGGSDRMRLQFRDAAGNGGFNFRVDGDSGNTLKLEHVVANVATERLRIDSSGNVGIGTDAPGNQLEVAKDGANAVPGIVSKATDTGVDCQIRMTAFSGGGGAGFIGSTTNHPVYLQSNNVNNMVLQPNGDTLINTGNMVISVPGKGIQFSPFGVGTGGNTLDDYEEGTWTPTLTGTSGEASYNWRYGQYTKVGKQVTIVGRFGLGGKNTLSGGLKIGGLPFSIDVTSSSGGGYMAGLNIFRTYSSSLTNIQSINESNSNSIKLFNGEDNSTLDTTEIGSSQRFFFSMTYMAA